MRTSFFGSHNSHPSHPISALTVSSAHSIFVPLAISHRERHGHRREEWTGIHASHAGHCTACEGMRSKLRLSVSGLGARRSTHYSMIRSARTNTDCGILTPTTFAVVRLMTRSNLVGC